jgi:hypothetical protein
MGHYANALDFLLGEWDIAMLVMPEGAQLDGAPTRKYTGS